MKFRFYIDPESGAPHIYQHGVTEDEVADVIENPGEDRSRSESARVVVGADGSWAVFASHLCSGTRWCFCNYRV